MLEFFITIILLTQISALDFLVVVVVALVVVIVALLGANRLHGQLTLGVVVSTVQRLRGENLQRVCKQQHLK
jgi:hypothetical protein